MLARAASGDKGFAVDGVGVEIARTGVPASSGVMLGVDVASGL